MWITEFREANGLTLEELGRAIRYNGMKKRPPMRVSDILLENLEMREGYRTIPALADLIAETCGATAKQRDELVLKEYRGSWTPKGTEPMERALKAIRRNGIYIQDTEERIETEAPVRSRSRLYDKSYHAVYAIDRHGRIVHRYPSVKNVEANTGMHPSCVRKRCLGFTKGDEFVTMGYTFRYADIWDNMTDDERQAEVEAAARNERSLPGHIPKYRNVIIIDRNGNTWRRDTIKEAAQMTGDTQSAVCMRVHGQVRATWSKYGFAYCRAERWEAMSEEERAEYLKE